MSRTRKNSPRFVDVQFRPVRKNHSNCTFLGYADATLQIPSGLGKDLDLLLRIRGLQVKVLNGTPRIDFPSERGQDGNYYPLVFPKSAESRTALTDSLLQDEVISAELAEVLEAKDLTAS